jgi:hypothetical protein
MTPGRRTLVFLKRRWKPIAIALTLAAMVTSAGFWQLGSSLCAPSPHFDLTQSRVIQFSEQQR